MFARHNRLALNCIFFVMLVSFLSGCASLIHKIHSDPIVESRDVRTWGGWLDDQQAELVSDVNLHHLVDSRIIPLSFNGYVLLIGQVPDEDIRSRAEQVVRQTRGIRQLFNELQVGKTISVMEQLKDAWITSSIKLSMLFARNVPSSRIRVVTEAGVVYLMGLVTQEEARQATAVVQRSGGVQRVVKVFEYL